MIGTIGNRFDGIARRGDDAPSGTSTGWDFQALVAGASPRSGAAPARPTSAKTTPPRQPVDNGARLRDALAAFRKEATMTPAERARRDVLEKMDLTEEVIDAMSPEQRKATEDKIAAEVARRLRMKDAAPGRI